MGMMKGLRIPQKLLGQLRAQKVQKARWCLRRTIWPKRKSPTERFPQGKIRDSQMLFRETKRENAHYGWIDLYKQGRAAL